MLWGTAELPAGVLHAPGAHAASCRPVWEGKCAWHAVRAAGLGDICECRPPLGTAQGQSVHATLLDFAQREGVDIMVLGEASLPAGGPHHRSCRLQCCPAMEAVSESCISVAHGTWSRLPPAAAARRG